MKVGFRSLGRCGWIGTLPRLFWGKVFKNNGLGLDWGGAGVALFLGQPLYFRASGECESPNAEGAEKGAEFAMAMRDDASGAGA